MAGILGQQLGQRALALVVNNTTFTPFNLRLHLYTNLWTPAPSDIVANYTESVASGYAPVLIAGAAWVPSLIGLGGAVTCPNQTFTFTSGDTIVGYYLTDPTNTIFMGAERLAAPVVIAGPGGILTVSVELEIITC